MYSCLVSGPIQVVLHTTLEYVVLTCNVKHDIPLIASGFHGTQWTCHWLLAMLEGWYGTSCMLLLLEMKVDCRLLVHSCKSWNHGFPASKTLMIYMSFFQALDCGWWGLEVINLILWLARISRNSWETYCVSLSVLMVCGSPHSVKISLITVPKLLR